MSVSRPVQLKPRSYATIVGVVGTVKRQLSDEVVKETYYYNLAQRGSGGGVLVVKVGSGCQCHDRALAPGGAQGRSGTAGL